MRHATPAALERLAPRRCELSDIPGLTERAPGIFSRHSRAFLHFHEDGEELFADVKGAAAWDRYDVTSPACQRRLLATVRGILAGS